MDNPRKLKKQYMQIFKDEKLYKIFLELYDKAVENGLVSPVEMAMVDFRELYIRTSEGWILK